MKRFIILSALLISAVASWACTYEGRPHYYVFSVVPTKQYQQVGHAEMVKFWTDYIGDPEKGYAVDNLSFEDPDDFNNSENEIIKCARQKGDKETLAYLKQLVTYLRASNSLNGNAWEYPSKEDKAKYTKTLNSVKAVASNYNGERYKAQYALLVMRCNLALGKDEANKSFWSRTGYAMPKGTVYRDMMKGIYAHALLKEGKADDALKIYTALGDMQSIKWLMRNKRNLKGIKDEYTADANASTLLFLVQDFVNNAQETKDNTDKGITLDKEWLETIDAKAIYDQEIRQFIDFAKNVVTEGKTKSPAMWQAAAGYLTSMLGDDQEAAKMLDKAMTMDGTDRMKDNARVCRLAVACKSASNDAQYKDYLCGELKWLQDMAEKTKPSGDMHYNQMVQRFVFDDLAPAYMKIGNANLATNIIGYGDKNQEYYDKNYSLLNNGEEYRNQVDKLTAEELVGYKKYMSSNHDSSLEKWLAEEVGNGLSENDYNDFIGTKFMREGNFQAAIPYLEKLSISYISEQGINRYMCRRDYKVERWMKRQPVDFEDGHDSHAGATTNQKLNFCRDIVALENAPKTEERDYKLASMLYQASYKGDCWYLTRLGQSAADTVSYRNEAPLVQQTIDLLKPLTKSNNFSVKEKALYALAFIPYKDYDGALFYTEYTKNYTPIVKLNKKSEQYKPMSELLAFYKANPTKVSKFVSKCDVLKQFSKLTAKKTTTSSKKHRRS